MFGAGIDRGVTSEPSRVNPARRHRDARRPPYQTLRGTMVEHEVTAPRLPVSEEEVNAAENAETAFRDVYDSSEQAAYSTDRVPVMLRAAHAVLVPRIERALDDAI